MNEENIIIKKDEIIADGAEGIIVGVAVAIALWGWAKVKGAKTSNTEEEVPKATEYSKDNGKVQL